MSMHLCPPNARSENELCIVIKILLYFLCSGYDVNLGDAIELLCPANLTGKHGLYHLFEDQYDNCSPPEDRNYVIGECMYCQNNKSS